MKRLFLILGAAGLIFMNTGCGLDGNSIFNIHDTVTGSTDIRLSGNLSLSSSSKSVMPGMKSVTAKQVESYKLYCVTFEETTSSASGSASSTGAFTLDLPNARNVPFGCFVQQVSDSTVVATLVFQDSTETGMGGDSQQQGTVSLTGNANLGTIVVDLDTGTATVDMSQIVLTDTDESAVQDTSTLAAGELFDFTGTWEFANMDTLPSADSGYTALPACCTQAEIDAGTCGNDGPCVGFTIYMKRVAGKAYEYTGTPDSNTDWLSGTTNQNRNVFGIMVWSSEGSFNTCGNSLGFTNNEAKRFGRVDFDGFVDGTTLKYVYSFTDSNGNGVYDFEEPYVDTNNNGQWDTGESYVDVNGNLQWDAGESYVPFNWTDTQSSGPILLSDGTTTVDVYDGWKDQNATANWNMWAVLTQGEAFIDANGNGWYDNEEWFDDYTFLTGDPRRGNGVYDIGEWYDDWNGNGVRDTAEKFFDGYNNYIDSNNNGLWDQGEPLGTVGPQDGVYNWPINTQVANTGDLCSSLSLYPFEQMQCYANALWDLPGEDPNLCIKEIKFNWRATNLNDFLNSNNGPGKPRSRFVFEKFIYSSPTSGSFTNTEQWEEGFEYTDPNGSSGNDKRWVNCQIQSTMEFNVTYLNDTTLVGDMKQVRILLPINRGSEPLCLQEFEPFQDKNTNGVRDNDQFLDDGNDALGGGPIFTAGNGVFDFTDVNGNGRHDSGEPSETITVDDNGNGAYENESYVDIDGSGTFTTNTSELYTDVNGNGRYDEGVDIFDLANDTDGNGKFTDSFHIWVMQQLGIGTTRTMMKFLKQ